jgi:hypothetical protein
MSEDIKDVLTKARNAISDAFDECHNGGAPWRSTSAALTRLDDQLRDMLSIDSIISSDIIGELLVFPVYNTVDGVTSQVVWWRKLLNDMETIARAVRGASPESSAVSFRLVASHVTLNKVVLGVVEAYQRDLLAMRDLHDRSAFTMLLFLFTL